MASGAAEGLPQELMTFRRASSLPDPPRAVARAPLVGCCEYAGDVSFEGATSRTCSADKCACFLFAERRVFSVCPVRAKALAELR